MATTTLPLPPAMPVRRSTPLPPLPVYRLSVNQYHQMIDAGIFNSDERVELLDGLLVPKMSKNPAHATATKVTERWLERIAGMNYHARIQDPITLSSSEPEPDVALVRGRESDYWLRHPGPQDILIAVEVAESSLTADRAYKMPLYAADRIAVYWIVNLADGLIEVYTDPTGLAIDPTYRQRRDYGPNDEVPVEIDGVEVGRIPVRELLP